MKTFTQDDLQISHQTVQVLATRFFHDSVGVKIVARATFLRISLSAAPILLHHISALDTVGLQTPQTFRINLYIASV